MTSYLSLLLFCHCFSSFFRLKIELVVMLLTQKMVKMRCICHGDITAVSNVQLQQSNLSVVVSYNRKNDFCFICDYRKCEILNIMCVCFGPYYSC